MRYRFRHNGMVGIGHAAAGDALSHFPRETFLVDEQTHHLGDRQSGVGIIDVNRHLIREIVQGSVGRQMISNDALKR